MTQPSERSRGETGPPAGAAARFRPRSFERRLRMLEALDPHFAHVWLRYADGLLGRPQLDLRTRLLVLAGQYTMLRDRESLADTVAAAIAEGVDPKEVLESILQCLVYTGEGPVFDAVDVFVEVAGEGGALEAVEATGLPPDATTAGRSLEEERETWATDDREDPRLGPLLETYGWTGISTALRLRPGHHINMLAQLDALDPHWAGLWLATCYEGMYTRRVLDDRTRLLCMVGDCLAVGEMYNASRHMRGALRLGATPAEVFEVAVQSCIVVGHPNIMGAAVNDLVLVLDDLGRLGELVASERIDGLRAIVHARTASRGTVSELKASDGRPTI